MDIKHIKDVLNETKDIIKKRRDGEPFGFVTGLKKFDEFLGGGIPFFTTMTIGARPSVGKSAFATILALQIQKLNSIDHIILYWSFEMPAYQQGLRILSHKLEIPVKELISPLNKEITEDLITKEIKELENSNLVIIDTPKQISYIKNIITNYYLKNPNRMILNIIDHTRLVIPDKVTTEENKIFELMSLMNETNKKYNCTNIVLSQLNRKVEDAAQTPESYRKPGQGDLFGADAVAQFSNIILTLHRPEMYGINYYRKGVDELNMPIIDNTKNKLYVEICKNRDGELGTLTFNHNLKINKIYE
jgi:replicative DNA helicase